MRDPLRITTWQRHDPIRFQSPLFVVLGATPATGVRADSFHWYGLPSVVPPGVRTDRTCLDISASGRI